MFGIRSARSDRRNHGIVPAAQANDGGASNFDPNNKAHVKATISQLLVMINDVANTVPAAAAAAAGADADIAVDEVNIAAAGDAYRGVAGVAGAGGVNNTAATQAEANASEARLDVLIQTYNGFRPARNPEDQVAVVTNGINTGANRNASNVYSLEIVKWRNGIITGAGTNPVPAKPSAATLFSEVRSILEKNKQLISNLIDAAEDIDNASSTTNGKTVNDVDNTSGYSVREAEKELEAVLNRGGFGTGATPTPVVLFPNLANVLLHHVANPVIPFEGDVRGVIDALNSGGANLAAGAPNPNGLFAGNHNVSAAGAAAGGAPANVFEAVEALKQKLRTLNRESFLKAFDADVPGSPNHRRIFGSRAPGVAADAAAGARVPATDAVIIEKLQGLLTSNAHKLVFGPVGAGAFAAVGDWNGAAGQTAVVNNLQRIFDAYPAVAANTPAHKFLDHIVLAPTNLTRIPPGWNWTSPSDFLGYLRLTDADLKALGKILGVASDEVTRKIASSNVFIQALKDLKLSVAAMPQFPTNRFTGNPNVNLSLDTINPELMRIYNLWRRSNAKKVMAVVRPASAFPFGMPAPFSIAMRGGALSQPISLDHPIEMRVVAMLLLL